MSSNSCKMQHSREQYNLFPKTIWRHLITGELWHSITLSMEIRRLHSQRFVVCDRQRIILLIPVVVKAERKVTDCFWQVANRVRSVVSQVSPHTSIPQTGQTRLVKKPGGSHGKRTPSIWQRSPTTTVTIQTWVMTWMQAGREECLSYLAAWVFLCFLAFCVWISFKCLTHYFLCMVGTVPLQWLRPTPTCQTSFIPAAYGIESPINLSLRAPLLRAPLLFHTVSEIKVPGGLPPLVGPVFLHFHDTLTVGRFPLKCRGNFNLISGESSKENVNWYPFPSTAVMWWFRVASTWWGR